MPGDRLAVQPRVSQTIVLCVALCLIAVTTASRPARAAATVHTVHIKNFVFEPARLEVQSGDTVVWTNDDIVPHTATAKPGFDSKGIDPERSWRFVTGSTGTFAYVCTFHPTMKGELVVR